MSYFKDLMKQKEFLIEEFVRKAKKLADEYGNIDFNIDFKVFHDDKGATYGIDSYGNPVIFIDGKVGFDYDLDSCDIEILAYMVDMMIAIEKGEKQIKDGIIVPKKIQNEGENAKNDNPGY